MKANLFSHGKKYAAKLLFTSFLSFLLSFNFTEVKAQDLKGTEFWLTVPESLGGFTTNPETPDEVIKLYITGYYDTPITVEYPATGIAPATLNLTGGSYVSFNCRKPRVDQLTQYETQQNNGIRVTSVQPVAVYLVSYILNSVEVSSILPINLLGTDYITSAYRENKYRNDNFSSRVNVVALENNTQVNITLPSYTWTSKSGNWTTAANAPGMALNRAPNSSWNITLNKGQTYSFICNDNNELSATPAPAPAPGTIAQNLGLNGVRVTCTNGKKIAIIGGTDCTRIGDNDYPGCSACDITHSQLVPISQLSNRYVTTQTLLRANNTIPLALDNSIADYLFIVSPQNGTNVNINGLSSASRTMNANDFWLYEPPGSTTDPLNPGRADNIISANNPIHVIQLEKGVYCDNDLVAGGDPSQMTVYPEALWDDDYILVNPSDAPAVFPNNYLNLIVKDTGVPGNTARSSFKLFLNGTPVTVPAGTWTQFGTEPYYWNRIVLSGTGTLKVRADSVFGYISSGAAGAGSYGFMGGASCGFKQVAAADPVCQLQETEFYVESIEKGEIIKPTIHPTYQDAIYKLHPNIDAVPAIPPINVTGNFTLGSTYATYTYPDSGTYRAVLELTDVAGCYYKDTFLVRVNPMRNPNFEIVTNPVTNPVSACLNEEVTITYLGKNGVAGTRSTAVPSKNPNFTWNLNGGVIVSGGSGSGINADGPFTVMWPSATVLAGTKTVTLQLSETGCDTSASRNIIIKPSPAKPTANNTGPYCEGATINLTGTVASGSTPEWTYPDIPGVVSSTSLTPTRSASTAAMSGIYILKAKQAGCYSEPATTTVTVTPLPVIPTIGFNPSPACEGDNVTLSATNSPPYVAAATYSWTSLPTGFTSSLANPVINNVGAADGKNYKLRVTLNGCVSPQGSGTLTVNPKPLSPSLKDNNGAICEGKTISLSIDNPISGVTYDWTGPNSYVGSGTDITITNATLAMAGDYYATATELGCKSLPATIKVIVNALPNAPTPNYINPVCEGTTLNLTIVPVSGALSYRWEGPSGYTASSQNPFRSPATAATMNGTYKAYVTSSANCESLPANLVVAITPLKKAKFEFSPNNSCSGAPDGQLPNPTDGALSPGTFSVNPSGLTVNPTTGALTLSSSATKDDGPYIVTFQPSGSCATPWSSPFSYTSNVDDDFGYNAEYCQGAGLVKPSFLDNDGNNYGGIPGTFTVTPTSGLAINSSTGEIDLDASTPGDYEITNQVKDCAGVNFPSPAKVNIKINLKPAAPTLANPISCAGQNVVIDPAPAIANIYTWKNPSGTVISTGVSGTGVLTISNASTTDGGPYTLQLTDAKGCISNPGTSVVTINVSPSTPIPTAAPNPLCEGNSLILSANVGGMDVYNWTGPNGFTASNQNPIRNPADPSMSGDYFLSVSDNGCTSSLSSPLNVVVNPTPAEPVAGNNGDPDLCEGETLVLNTPPVTNAIYEWEFPSGTKVSAQNPSLPNVTVANAGSYKVTVEVAGCKSPQGITIVTVNPLPNAPTITNNTPICEGTDLTFSASNVGNGAQYYWSGPNGYTSIGQFPQITAATIAQHSGNYKVYAVLNGCTGPLSLASTPVINAEDISAFRYRTVVADNVFCQSGSDQLATKNTGAAAGSFNTSAIDLNLDVATGKIDVSASKPGTYDVTYTTNNNGQGSCPSSTTIPVTIISPPDPAFTYAVPTACNKNSVKQKPSYQSGATMGTFSASPAGLNINSSTGEIDPVGSTPNTYTITNYVAPMNGCSDTSETFQVVILGPDKASFTYDKAEYCVSGIVDPIINKDPGGTFKVSPVSGLSLDPSSGTIILSASTPGSYTITYDVSKNCPNSSSTTIKINPPLTSNFKYDETAYCIDPTADVLTPELLGANTGGTYSVKSANAADLVINSNTGVVDVVNSKAGVFDIEYLVPASKGCAPSSTIFPITLYALPSSDFGFDVPEVCAGKPVLVTYNGDPTMVKDFNWNFANPDSKTGDDVNGYTLIWNIPGEKKLSLELSDDNCYSVLTNKKVKVNPNALAGFTSNPPFPYTIELGMENNINVVEFTNTSTDASIYKWTFGTSGTDLSENPVHTFTDTGTYYITLNVDNEFGCPSSYTDGPLYVSADVKFKIPNAFTPNGDDINDEFMPVKQGMKKFSLEVYNRWGELIFFSTTKELAWDGSFQGKPAPSGVYVYVLKGTSILNENISEKGLVTLKR